MPPLPQKDQDSARPPTPYARLEVLPPSLPKTLVNTVFSGPENQVSQSSLSYPVPSLSFLSLFLLSH